MPKKRNVRITKHSATRAKQRLGHTKNGVAEMSKRAFATGLRASQTHGALHAMLSSYSGRTIVYYANAIYIFGYGDVLVTVLDKGTSFDKELYLYVDYPTYMFYKQNRYKYQTDRSKLKADLETGAKYYTGLMNDILAPYNVSVRNIHTVKGGGYEVSIDIDFLPDEVMDQILAETGVPVTLSITKDMSPDVKKLAHDMRTWFAYKGILGQICKVTDTSARLIVHSFEDKIKVKEQLEPAFEETFKRDLEVELKDWGTKE